MFLFQRKYRPLLGLDITTSSVKLIELTMAGGQYRVEAYAAEPTPQNAINEKAIVDAEAVGEAVQRPTMRFVPLKTVDQLDLQAVRRVRARLVSVAQR